MAEPARNVLLLTGRADPPGDSGSPVALLDRLARRGIAARLLCVSRPEGAGRDERLVECPGLGPRWRQPWAVRALGLGDGPDRPELLHVLEAPLGPAGLAIAEHWRLPYLLTVDEFLGPGARLRLSRRWCRGLVAPCRELAADLARGFGAPPSLIAVVRPAVSPPEDPPMPAALRPARVPVIGTAGPLVPASGFAVFLGAARRVLEAGVDAEFVIAGQGDDEVNLRRRADRLRIAERVTFADHSVMGVRFWGVLDVFCQTSLVPTVGRVLATAMAAGVPSIAADVEGQRSLIDHDANGLRVPPDDPSALASTILSLLADPARARRLGRGGRDAVLRDFHPDEQARDLERLYRSVLSARDEAQPLPAMTG